MKELLLLKKANLETKLAAELDVDKIFDLRIEYSTVLEKLRRLEGGADVKTLAHSRTVINGYEYNIAEERKYFNALDQKIKDNKNLTPEEWEHVKVYNPDRLRWQIEEEVLKANNKLLNKDARIAAASKYKEYAEMYNLAVDFEAFNTKQKFF